MNPLTEGLKGALSYDYLSQLAKVKVGIGGAGGLGSNIAVHLVRSGFIHLVLVDYDQVEAGNLNRQFYFPDQLGRAKVDALAENLLRINPELKLTLFNELISAHNFQRLFGECQILVEALDQASSKKMFVENALQLKKRVVGASGLAGWGNIHAIKTKILNSGLALVGDQSTAVGKNVPPMSPRVGTVAAIQADIVLQWSLMEAEL